MITTTPAGPVGRQSLADSLDSCEPIRVVARTRLSPPAVPS
jgi:hypothetical protein